MHPQCGAHRKVDRLVGHENVSVEMGKNGCHIRIILR
jgi:hypothetical protein